MFLLGFDISRERFSWHHVEVAWSDSASSVDVTHSRRWHVSHSLDNCLYYSNSWELEHLEIVLFSVIWRQSSTNQKTLTILSTLMVFLHFSNSLTVSNILMGVSGEVLSFGSLVYSIFEFIQGMMDSSKFRGAIRKALSDLLYYVILYMQITEDQVGLTTSWTFCRQLTVCCLDVQVQIWSENPDQFVEDEDDETFSYSVRISSQDLLLVRYIYVSILMFKNIKFYFCLTNILVLVSWNGISKSNQVSDRQCHSAAPAKCRKGESYRQPALVCNSISKW